MFNAGKVALESEEEGARKTCSALRASHSNQDLGLPAYFGPLLTSSISSCTSTVFDQWETLICRKSDLKPDTGSGWKYCTEAT